MFFMRFLKKQFILKIQLTKPAGTQMHTDQSIKSKNLQNLIFNIGIHKQGL